MAELHMTLSGRSMTDDRRPLQRKPANLRTALVLLSIAVMFFAGVIAKRVFLG